jgi:hypothetical protein
LIAKLNTDEVPEIPKGTIIQIRYDNSKYKWGFSTGDNRHVPNGIQLKSSWVKALSEKEAKKAITFIENNIQEWH